MLVKAWLLYNTRDKANESWDSWPRIFTIACWWLRRGRNERSSKNSLQITADQVTFIYARLKQVGEAICRFDRTQGKKASEIVESFIRWVYPCVGWVELNTDGAAKGNLGNAGAGCLIRGHRGKLFEVFAMNCGVCTCTKAELLAIIHSLLIAWNAGHRKVQVNVDSKIVVQLLEDERPTSSPYIHIIKKCKRCCKEKSEK